MKRKIVIIINPISGVGKKDIIPTAVEKGLNKDDFEFSIVETDYAGHGYVLAKEAVENKFDAVIAVGGDGSVNDIGTALIHSETALGIIPSGSGNGIARSLGIPIQIKKAIEAINFFKLKRIDTGIFAGEKKFIGVAGFGFDALVGQKFLNLKKRGLFSYVQVIAMEYGKFFPQEIQFRIDNGELISEKAFVLCAANTSQYGNNAFIAPTADSQDGLLDFVILKDFPRYLAPAFILRLFNKSILKSKFVKHYRGKSLQVFNENAFFHLDGEPTEKFCNPQIEVVPNSLNVITTV